MADNPQETIRELRELVVAYAKQEAVDPLKGLARYVALGIAGALFIGFGVTFLAIGGLRVLQGDSDGPHFTGNWTWVPYVIVLVGMVVIAAISFAVGTRSVKKKNKGKKR
ncbi:MAG TPA: phage holin family protein [Acidimicrobiia bacterium]|nr:phage holin family protein [Acidimicrobiia bacterium]